jgi:hypothetical protein
VVEKTHGFQKAIGYQMEDSKDWISNGCLRRNVMWGIPYVRRKKKAQNQAGAGKDQVTAPTN